MLGIILHEMEGLSLEEKRTLINATKAAVARELGWMAGDAAPDACPWCGSSSFIRKGRNRDGSQRWLCSECGRTFSAKSRGLLAASKLDAATWGAFVESTEPCQYNGQGSAQGGVLLWAGLVRGDHGGVHGQARCLPVVVP